MGLSIQQLKSSYEESVSKHAKAKLRLAKLRKLRETVSGCDALGNDKKALLRLLDRQIAEVGRVEFASEGNIWLFGTQLEREGVAV